MAKKSSSSSSREAKLAVLPHFVEPGEDPLRGVSWAHRPCQITDGGGRVVFEAREIEAPESWSQLAVDIAVSKYLRLSHGETSVRSLIFRVVDSIVEEGGRQGILAGAKSKDTFRAELLYLLVHQKAAFNSPVWFNVGIHKAYKIGGGPGLFKYNADAESIVSVSHAFESPQSSACFILGVEDSLDSIFRLVHEEARIFKYGSGSGTNFSKLRGRGERLEAGGESSGLIAFLEVLDRGAGATKSGGTSRRAAKMVCLDVDHPDILDFIQWKVREEKKAQALRAAGFGDSMDSESYRTVSGQNSNNSVRISDTFLEALARDGDWVTHFRATGQPGPTFRARDLWRSIAEAAWTCADPGLQFHDTINHWHTCPVSGEIRASNPCSEFMFVDNSACNLASINIASFLQDDGSLDLEGLLQAVRIIFIAQEILIDMAGYPTPEVAKNSYDLRPLGLGFANLGGLLMRLGLPYDSDLAREIAAGLAAVITAEAYLTSSDLAVVREPFVGFKANRSAMLRVLDRHAESAEALETNDLNVRVIHELARGLWREVVARGAKTGFRNAQATAIAPTGTIGLMMDCETLGVEPEFSLIKFKSMVGGGFVRMVNNAVPIALVRLGYSKREVDAALKYLAAHETLEGCSVIKPSDLSVFDCAERCGPKGRRLISVGGHLRMMASIQPFVSGAISKTVNLPAETTIEQIESIYLEAWRLGLKSISIYRSGSKFAEPLRNCSVCS